MCWRRDESFVLTAMQYMFVQVLINFAVNELKSMVVRHIQYLLINLRAMVRRARLVSDNNKADLKTS